MQERLPELRRFEENVEREVDAHAPRVREAAGRLEILEGELRVVVARVEFLDAEIDRIGAVGDGRPNGVETPGGGEQLRHGTARGGNGLLRAGDAPHACCDLA